MSPVYLPLRRSRPFALLCALVMGSACLPAFAKDQVPEWVKTAAQTQTPDLPGDADAVVLLEETTYTLAPNGALIHHFRKVVKVLRPQGRKYAYMAAEYRSITKLNYLHIWSIGADGKEYVVKDKEQNDFAADAGFELYGDSRARGLMPPAMDVGAIAAMEYERQEVPYENDIIWIPGEDVPVVRERLSLNLPDGYTYKATWKGKPKAPAVDAEHGRTLWEVENQAGLFARDKEPLAPSEISQAPRMDIFYQSPAANNPYGAMSGDWRSIGEWYERLAKDRNKPDPAIMAKAQELVAGKSDFRDRVAAVAGFVQGDIRYVAIEVGVGGHQPHAAPDIFRARYGDCKDKATLLSAMLDAVGVRSTWVLVDTHRGVVSSESPSLLGNHMIAAIELPANYQPKEMYSVITAKSGKRFLIFDPTWEKTPFGHLESELQGSDALLVDGADSQVITLPVLKPEQNPVERSASFTLRADGSLSGNVTQREGGDIASSLRYLSLRDEKEQQQALDRSLARDLHAFHVQDMQMTDAARLDRSLELRYTVTAEHFAEPMGGLMTIRPRVLGSEAPAVDAKPRRLPIDLGETRRVQDDFTIALPPGFSVDELPPPVRLDVGFASYASESKVVGNAIHYSRTYTVREIALPAERYADVQKLAHTIAADEQSSAILKHAN